MADGSKPPGQLLVEAALAWHDAGFCVLPAAVDGSKRVGLPTWQQYQTARPGREQVAIWAVQSEGIGLIMGQVSGNAEMLEIEGKAQHLVAPLLTAIGAVSPELLARFSAYVEVTPSGGFHWIYRVEGDPVAGNTKLAQQAAVTDDGKPGRDTLLETRGEGGWVVTAPSAGRVHPSGGRWTTYYDSTPGVVGTLTATERDTLHAIARSFDLMPQVVIEHREARPVSAGDLTPGQDYEQRTSWADILEPEGWQICGRQGDKDLWTRPGKDARHGPSATTNYDGNDNLYVFSSSTVFDPNASYTKFAAYALLNHGGDYSAAARDLRGQGYGSQTPRDTSAAQADQRAMLDLLPEDTPTTVGHVNVPGEEGSSRTSFQLTDRGNGNLLAQIEHPRLRYAADRDAWLRWHEGRWQVQISDSAAIQAFNALVDLMDHTEKATYTHKVRSMSASTIEKAVRLAKKNPLMEVSIADFDAKPDELNTPDGVVNLLTGETTAHSPDGLHTRMTSVGVDPTLPCPRWTQFLADTFGEDTELIGFVQRLAGYSATGRVTHHVLPFLHGTGANGKSVFMDVLMRILGDYASTTPADFLLLGGREDEAAVARLSGLRLVVASEVGPTARFNEQKVKMLTGGDALTARFLYQNHFTFAPTHKLWLMGNHQPRVDAGGDSFWRRLRLVPFAHTVPEGQRIVTLADQLVREEGPAILAWIIEGARRQVTGLNEPDSVKAATSTYAEEEDHLGRFAEERIRFGGGDYVRLATADVRHAYEQWCFAEGEKPIPANVFGRELKARGAGSAKSGSRRFYTNVTLVRSEEAVDRERPEQLIYGIGGRP